MITPRQPIEKTACSEFLQLTLFLYSQYVSLDDLASYKCIYVSDEKLNTQDQPGLQAQNLLYNLL